MSHHAYRLTIFNHKGGVGKTTLTINIAAALAALGKRVLIVDSDPQCNLTSHLVPEDVVNDLLDHSDTPKGKTLWTALKPIVEGSGEARSIKPHPTPIEGVFLLPGDIKLSDFEQSLGEMWTECFARKIRGLRGTNALSSLVDGCIEKSNFDFVFYDTGPNIGPLNRVILLDCDGYIVPAACDLFSVRALNTLGQTLSGWIRDWGTITDLAPDDLHMMAGAPKFMGYIPQRFKVYGQQISTHHSHYLSKIEKHIYSDIINVMRKRDPELAPLGLSESKLTGIRDFSSNVQLAQHRGRALWDVPGGNQKLAVEARDTFQKLATKLISRCRALE